MSLFSSLQIANNSLIASQVGLQVTGNNIANANTPGYIRQEVRLVPSETQKSGELLLGLGVRVHSIVQRVDMFVEDRLRSANGDVANSETQERVYRELETLVGELGDTDLSTSMNNFFNSIHDVLNHPASLPVRNLAILQGQTLADDIRRLDGRIRQMRTDLNTEISSTASDINRLLAEVARLNVQIVTIEGGSTSQSDAVGLRDQRQLALSELSSLIDVRAIEQPNGAVSVVAGGQLIVFEGEYQQVVTKSIMDRGLPIVGIHLAATDSPVPATSGKVAGLAAARDEIIGGLLDQMDNFTKALVFEFNKLFSSGQGLTGYTELTSQSNVINENLPLDAAGLGFTPESGSFQVLILDRQTGQTRITDIPVDLDGLDSDTSLTSLVAALDAVEGLTARVTPQRRLELRVESSNLEFSFAEDTSGALAALGVNTFFTGSTPASIAVNEVLRSDPSKFAASRSGIGSSTDNALELARFLDQPIASQNNFNLTEIYEQMSSRLTQSSAVARSVAQGFRSFQKTLEGQKLAISGVSLDEEAMQMIKYQRTYQASARFVKTVSELLEMLVSL